jgi:hypothetical protein
MTDLPPAEYDASTDTWRMTFDPTHTGPTLAIVSVFRTLSERTGIETPQLYDLLDPDALERLLTSHHRKPAAGRVTVAYSVDQFRLEIVCEGTSAEVRVYPG